MSLSPLVGHDTERALLAGAFRRGVLPHALLFHGPRGVGKQRLALWTARLALCANPTAGPCGSCVSCANAGRLEHPDIHWYFPVPRPRVSGSPEKLQAAMEDQRRQGLEERRAHPLSIHEDDGPTGLYLALIRSLRTRAHKKPVLGHTQVFVVGDAEALVPQEGSPEAANAMLKLLEEPPGGTRFILTSSEPGGLLDTIRSRTLGLHLSPLPETRVAAFLSEHAGASAQDAARAAALSRGSIGRALGLLPDEGGDPGPLERVRQAAFALLRAALDGSSEGAFASALPYPPARARALVPLMDALSEWLRDLAAVVAAAPDDVPGPSRKALESLLRGRRPDPAAIARAMDAVQEAAFLATSNVNPQLIIFGVVHALGGAIREGRAA